VIPTPAPRLRMTGVAKAFAATQALRGVDCSVAAGEIHALIGENGAGKSTLMKILAGALVADRGSVHLDGEPYRPGDPLAARRRGVALVSQELAIAPDLSVAENVLLGRLPARAGLVRRGERDRLARAALAEVGRGDLALDLPCARLTPADRQLVEIARALVGEPRLLILDEPTSSLARDDVDRLFAVVRRLATTGVAVVYISHFLDEVQALCARYTVLRDGASVAGGEIAGTTTSDLVRAMVGRDVDEIYPRVPRALGEVVLGVDRLAGATKPVAASFALRRGEIFGLFGLVGAGRTETLRALFGLDRRRAGGVTLRGLPGPRTPPAWWRAGVGLVSENRKDEGLLLGLPIADNLTLTKLGPACTLGLLRGSRQRAAAAAWMERLGIKARGPAQAVGELSGGNQQKVAIGRLLHHGCDVLLLDEPTRGVDIGAKAAIYRLIGGLAAEGRAVVVVSSYIPELLGICDTVAAMCRGVLGAPRSAVEWTPATLLAAAIQQEAT